MAGHAYMFQRLNLWPRLALAATAGFIVLFSIFSLLSIRAVNGSTERILQERLAIAQMAAQEIDRLVDRGFYELEKATEFAPFDPKARSLAGEYHMLAHAYGRVGALSLGVVFLDADGRVVLAQPTEKLPQDADLSGESHIQKVRQSLTKSVSDPFVDPGTGKPAIAFTIPILNSDGELLSMLTGLVDVSNVEIMGPLSQARDIGHTGHAELVDKRGRILASTDYGGFLEPGEHLEFYLDVFQQGEARVENVPYAPWHEVDSARGEEQHVMAFVPLSSAPWGVAVGGSVWETFAPVTRLRNTILITGAVSLVVLWGLTLLGARLLVRPVRTLTTAARRMAEGNLEEPISIGEGGEITALGESLESMRAQLKSSMEQIRNWGQDLETKVGERTNELAAKNRQLAAVNAVATAANEIRDQEEMLLRCLEVVSEHTRMDTASIRLVDSNGGQLTVASALGDFSQFACRYRPIGLEECPCGFVTSTGFPLYLNAEERARFRPACRLPGARTVAILPLKSPTGVLGVLSLSRNHGEPPGPEERDTLEAICHQIAVAIQNTQLLGEIGRVEAQRELDRMKAEFISAVSHELRTPLGFIKGYVTTLSREDISIDSATRREFLQVIEEESDNLQRMIDDLLGASRLQAGRFQMDKELASLKELLERALHKAEPRYQQSGHSLETRLSDHDVTVLADAGRIEQVLHNLLDNASRYSPPGSPIEVESVIEDGRAIVRVKDFGVGVAAHELERVFEPFYRGKSSQGRDVRGTGLGLSISRSIIQAHGGQIWAESNPNGGSTFSFTLPIAQCPVVKSDEFRASDQEAPPGSERPGGY